MLNRELTIETMPRAVSFERSLWQTTQAEQHVTAVRRMIWVYFWILIFEGALRKWVTPLSMPFIVMSNHLALLI